nr:uncharacterized protein LOC109187960 [Ipomoea batatas]
MSPTASSRANVSAASENEGWVPLLEPGKAEKMAVMLNDTRRKLGSFQICTLCTCCGGVGKCYYLPTPCCYNINCSIPNRSFGFCSFTPKVPRPVIAATPMRLLGFGEHESIKRRIYPSISRHLDG